MDFLGIGPLEVILILLIGFIIFGPEKLIEMSKSAGKAMSNLSKSASSFNEKLNQEIKISDLSASEGANGKDNPEKKDTPQS
jgi:TatA/E family protein of Tat protein translocase